MPNEEDKGSEKKENQNTELKDTQNVFKSQTNKKQTRDKKRKNFFFLENIFKY